MMDVFVLWVVLDKACLNVYSCSISNIYSPGDTHTGLSYTQTAQCWQKCTYIYYIHHKSLTTYKYKVQSTCMWNINFKKPHFIAILHCSIHKLHSKWPAWPWHRASLCKKMNNVCSYDWKHTKNINIFKSRAKECGCRFICEME